MKDKAGGFEGLGDLFGPDPDEGEEYYDDGPDDDGGGRSKSGDDKTGEVISLDNFRKK